VGGVGEQTGWFLVGGETRVVGGGLSGPGGGSSQERYPHRLPKSRLFLLKRWGAAADGDLPVTEQLSSFASRQSTDSDRGRSGSKKTW